MNNQVSNYDITIVGGGMVGASLALLLNKELSNKKLLAEQPRNWRILVVEANPQQQASETFALGFDDRSTALSYSTREIFQKIGLWPQLQQRAAAIEQIQVSDRGHVASTRLNAAEQGVDAYGYVVENRWLGSVLQQALDAADVEVAAPATVDAVNVVRGGVELTLSDRNQPIHTELLVVADGARSATRDKLGITSRVRDYGQMGLIANIALAEPHNGVACERFTDEGPMALLPLPDSNNQQHSALVWTLPPEKARHLHSCPEAEFLQELHNRFGYRQGQLIAVGERQLYPLKLLETAEQVRRNVVVVGNAAHSLHPVAGQGFNLAMRDIASLTATLAEGAARGQSPGELSLLQGYLDGQAADQERTVAASDWLPRLFGMSSPAVAATRGLGLLALDMAPGLRGQFARYGMGLE